MNLEDRVIKRRELLAEYFSLRDKIKSGKATEAETDRYYSLRLVLNAQYGIGGHSKDLMQ